MSPIRDDLSLAMPINTKAPRATTIVAFEDAHKVKVT
jgi:hypothetical protein